MFNCSWMMVIRWGSSPKKITKNLEKDRNIVLKFVLVNLGLNQRKNNNKKNLI